MNSFMIFKKSVFFVAFFFAMLVIFCVSAYRSTDKKIKQSTCRQNIKEIEDMMYIYKNNYGDFPPPITYDNQGNPMHSWRILLLKVSSNPIDEQYNFSEPWNSPSNSRFAEMMPELYACPNSSNNAKGHANYFLIVSSTKNQNGQINQKPPIIVESCNFKTNWLEPKDFEISEGDNLMEFAQRVANSEDIDGPAILDGNNGITRMGHQMKNKGR